MAVAVVVVVVENKNSGTLIQCNFQRRTPTPKLSGPIICACVERGQNVNEKRTHISVSHIHCKCTKPIPIVDDGAITMKGPDTPCDTKWAINAILWTVLPNPISSARMPLML